MAEFDRKKYERERYKRRMTEAKISLGGLCQSCGCSDLEVLEFDHVDPATKEAKICDLVASGSQASIDSELKKCQLLCRRCHDIKTTGGAGRKIARLECPVCGVTFDREYRKTAFGKTTKGYTTCSRSCGGKVAHAGIKRQPDTFLIEVFWSED